MKVAPFFLFFCLFAALSFANNNPVAKKQIKALRTNAAITIDGVVNEPDWQNAEPAKEFIENSPKPGTPSDFPSDIRVIYDNTAMYISATLHDSRPDSIFQQLTERDEIGIVDWFGVIIDTYRDGNNGTAFFVTAAGVQYDSKFTTSNINNCDGDVVFCGDQNWDAVWDSEVQLTENGWVIEIKLPYAALRFPETAIQSWNINFVRMVRRHREMSFWNEVKPEGNVFLQQSGEIVGIQDIKSPLRLSFTPYIAGYVEDYFDKNAATQHSWGRSVNGGMDVKYGLNDAFTLDMTLIPDFGEARSDNKVLNLTPFEVQFSENRQFFTEGVELFNKGGIFYSRRIGGRPLHYWEVEDQLQPGETISENPATTGLYNATKLSGRTSKGTGIGVFNAVAKRTVAKVKNAEGDTREIETAPLTNYNVFVVDQNLPNNSYATFTNTNVWRNGSDYDANVTSGLFELRNKKNTYSFFGRGVVTQKYYPGEDSFGHRAGLQVNKTSGNWRGSVGYAEESVNYDPNDLGILFAPNERNWWVNVNYNRYKAFGPFNQGGGGFFIELNTLYAPFEFSSAGMETWMWAVTKNFWGMGFNTWTQPFRGQDFFEPQVYDWKTYYKTPANHNTSFWINSDYRKKFAFDFNTNYRKYNFEGQYRLNANFAPRFRANDKLSFILELGSYNFINDRGRTTSTDDAIIFARRDVITVENGLTTKYAFNNKMTLSFRMRHYWSKVENKEFFALQEDGGLGPTDFNENYNYNYNAFNIDAIYRWRFAPGSDLFIIWKNSIDADDGLPAANYFDDVKDHLFELPQSNSLSVKLIYFLDYHTFIKK